MRTHALLAALALLTFAGTSHAQYPGWTHSGSIYILTMPEGANLPASAVEKDFPLLVRLDKESFKFSEAQLGGADLRFSAGGVPLAYQIEEWDAKQGTASVWVRVPEIHGNARQEIKLHWGNPDAKSESSGRAVFNESNGYLSVWHMSDPVQDEVGTLTSEDTGTAATAGMIGAARHFPGGKGIFCGDQIANYPSGANAHSTEAWFRIEQPNATLLGWGNEGGGRGSKVRMLFRSPAHIRIDSDFSDVKSDSRLPLGEWIHVVHTYDRKDGRIYINGRLDGAAQPLLNIKSPARLWLGGWYNNYDFKGDLDEVRISQVARSADWIKLQYENQNPLQTLVGPIVQSGDEFSVPQTQLVLAEGQRAIISAKADGAQQIIWSVKRGGRESVVATGRFSLALDAGRVVGDESLTLQLKAIYPTEVKTQEIAVTIKEDVPEPIFTLPAPATWDGRRTLEIVPQITNLSALRAKNAEQLNFAWSVDDIAVIKQVASGKLILKRAQNSGPLRVSVTIDNGGQQLVKSATILVAEPQNEPWVVRAPEKDEQPVDNQFYARDDKNEGTLHYRGTLDGSADAVFLKLYAEDKLINTESQPVGADKTYAFTVKLKPGLVHYKVEFGTKTGDVETIVRTVSNLVCGDAYLIQGQSNALATDTHEQSPPEKHDWIRSYDLPGHDSRGTNRWYNPVWRGQNAGYPLGYWGMELAKRLVKSQQMPICIINGAVGGTRIDQHLRSETDPLDMKTIYGRTLWRVRQAKLTHGIRGVLWHQGESDQGAQGLTDAFGWTTYQQSFIDLSAAWKEDFPNIQHYYTFQIWPNACRMGGGSGDMVREVQRTLPSLYSNMRIMSTLGIQPGGGCHYPLTGWAEFARLLQPQIERDHYGLKVTQSITPPNLKRAYYTSAKQDAIALEFDQPVVWTDSLVSEFYPDGAKDQVASGTVSGNVLTLSLKAPSTAQKITYLHEMTWSESNLLRSENGIAALTFCNVPIQAE